MKSRIVRLCIYPKDIQRITGKSDRYSRELLRRIRTSLGKQPHHPITVEEFSVYMGLSYEVVQQFIID